MTFLVGWICERSGSPEEYHIAMKCVDKFDIAWKLCSHLLLRVKFQSRIRHTVKSERHSTQWIKSTDLHYMDVSTQT